MKISDVRELLKNKDVIEEINRHLWIESQKAGYSIGIERATDEWLHLYAEGWMKYHAPEKFKAFKAKKKTTKKKTVAKVKKVTKIKKVTKPAVKKSVKKSATKRKIKKTK